MSKKPVQLSFTLATIAAIGAWLGWATTKRGPVATAPAERSAPQAVVPSHTPPRDGKAKIRPEDDPTTDQVDLEAITDGALANQRTLKFRSREEMEAFLRSLEGKGIRVLGRIDGLNVLRIGFDSLADLAGLPKDAEQGLIYPVNLPPNPEGGVQDGALGFGGSLLKWLGADTDRSGYGNGVKVAVLDTGVASHLALAGKIQQLELVPFSVDPSALNGHGTAVASLIAGSHAAVQGLAPGVDLLSIRVANDAGVSDSFTLAQGILAALDNGASLINISMGSYGNSPVLRDAVAQAIAQGAVIVASAGNEGYSNTVAYPAAYPGVIGVAAVEANSTHLDFSNSGSSVDVAAPGLAINAAWPGDKMISFTGTSASAPVVTGAIASAYTKGSTVGQAADLVLSNLNEGGYPGTDPQLGAGVLDVGRVERAKTPNVVDVAVASQVVDTSEVNPKLLVTIENRGTTTVSNTGVTVSSGGNQTPLNIPTLAAGQTHTFTLPVPAGSTVQSQVTAGGGVVDQFPSNNKRTDTIKR